MFRELPGPLFHDSGEIVIASDGEAERPKSFVRMNTEGNVEVLVERVGPSGSLFTMREVRPSDTHWRYLGEGETLATLASNMSYARTDFSETVEHSIADIVAKHALATAIELGLLKR